MNTKGKILTALAVGAAVGGILGVLFAPDKGSETRKKISEGSKKFTDGVKEKFEKGRSMFNHAKNGKEEATV